MLQGTFKFLLKISSYLHSQPIKKLSIFYVKNKPVLGGTVHFQIVTLWPGTTANPPCMPVTDLGLGFLIWLKDV